MEDNTNANNDPSQKIPLLSINAGPKDPKWPERQKEEYIALVEYMKLIKEDDNEWFYIEPNEDSTKWTGKCWYFYNYQKYEFKLQFEIPATYPATPIELELPELDGKTPKMYRGGIRCSIYNLSNRCIYLSLVFAIYLFKNLHFTFGNTQSCGDCFPLANPCFYFIDDAFGLILTNHIFL